MAPAIIVAGRIGLRVNWVLVFGIGALIFWLDQNPETRLRSLDALPETVSQLHAANFIITVVTLAALTQRYFLVIVRTQRRVLEFPPIDPLTGRYNRRHFLATAAQEHARSKRYGGPLCVALADLDHFNRVNDQLGHEAGDAVLRHASHVIRSTARGADCACR